MSFHGRTLVQRPPRAHHRLRFLEGLLQVIGGGKLHFSEQLLLLQHQFLVFPINLPHGPVDVPLVSLRHLSNGWRRPAKEERHARRHMGTYKRREATDQFT